MIARVCIYESFVQGICYSMTTMTWRLQTSVPRRGSASSREQRCACYPGSKQRQREVRETATIDTYAPVRINNDTAVRRYSRKPYRPAGSCHFSRTSYLPTYPASPPKVYSLRGLVHRFNTKNSLSHFAHRSPNVYRGEKSEI